MSKNTKNNKPNVNPKAFVNRMPESLVNYLAKGEAVHSQVLSMLAEIADEIDKLRQEHFCAYVSSDFCDCKFGYDKTKADHQQGEKTGCPELKSAVNALRKCVP